MNLNEPPAALLERLYRSRLNRHYGKVTDSTNLFAKLDPEQAYGCCPALAEMLEELLTLAKKAGP